MSPVTVLGIARSNSITVTAVILSITAVIFVRKTNYCLQKNWTVRNSITDSNYCPSVLLLLYSCWTVILSNTEYYCLHSIGIQSIFLARPDRLVACPDRLVGAEIRKVVGKCLVLDYPQHVERR